MLVMLLGATAIVRWDIAARREAFFTEARMAHRLLSQRAAQLDAVLASLVLLAQGPEAAADAERLPALWPGVLAVQRSDAQHPWPEAALAAAALQSGGLPAGRRHAVMTAVDPARMQYTLVLAGLPASWALRVDATRLIPAEGWPFSHTGPVRAELAAGSNTLRLHPGAPLAQQPTGLTPGFTFAKRLDTPSQPLELRLQRATGPAQWPWPALAAWALGCLAVATALWLAGHARAAQRRQAELMRMAQVGRLNTLSELTAGLAHELNQPLAAVLASTQAAQRLLPSPEGPELRPAAESAWLGLPSVHQALELAAGQAQRASAVLRRLRRLVQNPLQGAEPQAVDLHSLCLQMLDLLRPELQRRGITATVGGRAPAVWADPVMVEQMLHNLLTNAMQALEAAATLAPHIELQLQAMPAHPEAPAHAMLRLRDNGPGIPAQQLELVFEPFFSTRAGGLGLGLSLCETLARALGGTLQARLPGQGGGAEFLLSLPLAKPGPTAGRAEAARRPP